jgi:hypothetical protein
MAQVTVFSDNFANGSTFNGTSTPGGTPTASSTSYDFDSSKTGAESLTAGNLSFGLSAATTSGFVEGAAVFTSTPVAPATVGDYVDLTYTFTDTQNVLAGGTSSAIYTGLYNSGGSMPAAGTVGVGVSGNALSLNTTNNSPYATGNAAGWQGYAASIAQSGGSSKLYSRPAQTGIGTGVNNQELIGNGFGSGTYTNPPGSAVGGNLASTVVLTAGNQYTVDYRLTLSAAGVLTISDNLYNGVGTLGTDLSSQSAATTATLLTSSFDSLAIGLRNSGTSYQPTMDLNQITVTEFIQTPEPSTLALLGVGSLSLVLYRRRRA